MTGGHHERASKHFVQPLRLLPPVHGSARILSRRHRRAGPRRIRRRPQCRGAGQTPPHRRAPSRFAAFLARRGEKGQARQPADGQLVAAEVARRHGPGGHCHGHRLAHHAAGEFPRPRQGCGRAHRATDLVVLIHDTHHPITGYLYYEEQRAAAKLATKYFWRRRLPKFLRYFERVLTNSGGPYLIGRKLTYADLSLFQIVEGLRYAFPRRMKRFERKVPRVVALHDRVAQRPRIAAYLASKRRIPFSQWGIYRYFKELDR